MPQNRFLTKNGLEIAKNKLKELEKELDFVLSQKGEAAETSVKVVQKPVCDFTAVPTKITPPQKSTLTWSCQYADSCSIAPTIGSVEPNGSQPVGPRETTTYTLTCSNSDGDSSYQRTVEIGFLPWLKEIIPIWGE